MRTIDIYTDGSSLGNPGHAGYSVVLFIDGTCVLELSNYLGERTNNVAELTACIHACNILAEFDAVKATLYTDSKYVLSGIHKCHVWRTEPNRLNKDLWGKLSDILVKVPDISFEWVKGHSESKHNNRCDELAHKAATERKGYLWMQTQYWQEFSMQ